MGREVRMATPERKSGFLICNSSGRKTARHFSWARYARRSTIIFLISAMAFAGFRPFGQVWAQFMMVWHR